MNVQLIVFVLYKVSLYISYSDTRVPAVIPLARQYDSGV
jgi:hypothetical protein